MLTLIITTGKKEQTNGEVSVGGKKSDVQNDYSQIMLVDRLPGH